MGNANSLPAGRDLDAAVWAALGYTVRKFATVADPECGGREPCVACEHPDRRYVCSGGLDHADDWCFERAYGLEIVPDVSTEWNAAGLVIADLYGRGWRMSLTLGDSVSFPWDCRFFLREEKRTIAHGASGPHAIALAALAAVEGA